MKCPKCKGEMEKGYVTLQGYGRIIRWGREFNWLGVLKGEKSIDTFCCKNCGYLESYAK